MMFNKRKSLCMASVTIIVLMLSITHCQKRDTAPSQSGHDAFSSGYLKKPFLMLGQAQFVTRKGADGKANSVPGAARLQIVYPAGKTWKSEVIEDPDSNVFHKAMVFRPSAGSPGILTIGANKAMLKLWRHQPESGWKAEILWETEFGGTQNRLRDMETGDVTGNGKTDIVIATHDQGVIAVLEQNQTGWKVTELNRTPNTFVHEIEIGDVDGDGKNEFFATPSAPNKLDGTTQPGLILMYKYENGEFNRHVVEEFPTRHVKEILVADMFGQGHPDLYASVESEMSSRGSVHDRVSIKRYHWKDNKKTSETVGGLDDMLCRFLTAGDVNNDGQMELLASPLKSGVWMFRHDGSKWEKTQITTESSGFEHATIIADINENRKLEIYVAADDQNQLQQFVWAGSEFQKNVIAPISDNMITFGLASGKL